MTVSKSFEKPLTPEDENMYISKLKEEGDESAKEVLINRNMRLVAYIARKYLGTADDQDDLISVGTIGLIKAIDTYKMNKGTRLATYASRCIENEILMYIRSNKNARFQMSLQDPIGTDKDGNEINLMDILGTEIDSVAEKVQSKESVSKLYKKLNEILTPRERQIVELRYGLTPIGYKTQKEIATNLNISRSYVSRLEKKALYRLQQELANDRK
ncbi:MAG: RNA polymerase sporulation sigma factor SigK [Clostridioides sp.]|nr:RNA polymerase sporulation sigma factor SigK [Clostridioides sp.]